jgi:hypothetical protein
VLDLAEQRRVDETVRAPRGADRGGDEQAHEVADAHVRGRGGVQSRELAAGLEARQAVVPRLEPPPGRPHRRAPVVGPERHHARGAAEARKRLADLDRCRKRHATSSRVAP